MTVDYAHTRKAEQNRAEKAKALAAAARDLGVPAAGLGLGEGNRRTVRLALGFSSVSEDTWHLVVSLLSADAPPAGPRPRGCALCAAPDARLYICGWRCTGCSPAATAGRTVPTPPPGTTAVDLRRDRTPLVQVENDPRIESARRHSSSAADRAAIATEAHRRFGHSESARGP